MTIYSDTNPIMTSSSTQADIIVVGSCNTDLVTYMDHFPQVGETLQGTDFKQGFGGKGANQVVAAAQLGANVTMVACLGDDEFGHQTLKHFEQFKIDTQFMKLLEDAPSGIASIFVNNEGQNLIVTIPGANHELRPTDLEASRDAIRQAKVIVCQLEIRQETVRAAFEIARDAGVMTILNPAPAMVLIDGLLELCDLVVPNETELSSLTRMPVSSLAEIKIAAQALIQSGAKEVIVTLGSRGAMRVTKSFAVHHATANVTAFDSTGAGDAFIGALVTQFAQGIKMPMAINFANAAASISVTRAGAQSSFANRTEIKNAPMPEHAPTAVP